MERNLPYTSFYLEPNKNPEYRILSFPHLAPEIIYYSKRPTLCGTFHQDKEERLVSLSFLLAKEEKYASKLLLEKGVKYVFLSPDLFSYRKLFAESIGKSKYDFLILYNDNKEVLLSEDFLRTMYFTLYYGDGGTIYIPPTKKPYFYNYYEFEANKTYYKFRLKNYFPILSSTSVYISPDVAYLSHFRLIYESKLVEKYFSEELELMYLPSREKVFEFVKGCNIIGKTKPNTSVKITVKIKTNQNRYFTYQNT